MIQLALRQRFQVDEEGSAFIFCVLLGFCGLAFDDVFSAVVGIGSGGAHGCYYFVRCGVLGLRGPAGLGCPVPTKAFCPDRRSKYRSLLRCSHTVLDRQPQRLFDNHGAQKSR